MALAHGLERVEQHAAVASAGQSPAAVAEGGVVAPVHVLAELIARQPHRGAQALQALSRVMDGGCRVRVALAREPFDRPVELAERDALEPLRYRFVLLQLEAAWVLVG